MISSALPARLQFQCGHAALVTLPRVKGETAAQRNERIGREKSAALTRQCDFCAPAVEIAVNGNGNGNHHTVADLHVLEPVAAEPDRPELVVVSAAPETVEEAPEAELAAELSEPELVADLAEPELVALVAEFAEPELVALVAEVAEPEPVAEQTETELAPLDVVAEQPSPERIAVERRVPAKAKHVAPAAPVAPVAAPKRRAPQTRRARAPEVARGRRFLVEYRVERVLHAVDIHDALRQAASLGAAQLTAITRED